MSADRNRALWQYAAPASIAAITLFAAACQPPPREERVADTRASLASPSLSQFVLYAEESLTIGSHSQVEGGDVGIVGLTPPSFGAQLIVADHAQVDVGEGLIAPSASLASGAQVGQVETNILTNQGGHFTGQSTYPSSLPPMPLGSAIGVGGTDLSVASHQQITLTPGSYGVLQIGDHAHVTLAAGAYTFTSVAISDHVQITGASAGVTVGVAGTFTLGVDDQVAPAAGAKADKLLVSVAGSDSGTAHAAEVGEGCQVTALLLAPNGAAELGSHVQWTGAVAAFDVVVGDHAHVTFQSGFTSTPQVGSQQLSGYFDNPTDGSFSVAGPVPATTVIYLAIGLPGQDPGGLKDFARRVSDPKDPAYRQYLSFDQIKQTYGATGADYAALKSWATNAGFTIANSFQTGLLLGVTAPAALVEQALHVNLVLRNRIDGSGTQFVTPDREPSIDLAVHIARISGLDEYKRSIPAMGSCGCTVSSCCPPRLDAASDNGRLHGTSVGKGGSPNGLYGAQDIRNAYLGPNGSLCLDLDGTGQTIGLLVNDGWDDADITAYQQANGLPIRKPKAENPGPSSEGEATLDIEMAFAMAPGADVVVFVYSGQLNGESHYAALWNMTEPLDGKLITVASTSYVFTSDDNEQRALDVMAAEGISFFSSSGDFGAQGDPADFNDLENVTLVGGTFLSTNSVGVSGYPDDYYFGDNTWNEGCPQVADYIDPNSCTCAAIGPSQNISGKDITGGGIMNGIVNTQMMPGTLFGEYACGCFPGPFCCGGVVGIPSYQLQVQQTSASSNGGSVEFRNYPDVAILAEDIQLFFQGGPQRAGGTSASSPLWAGLAALVNQAAQQHGVPQLGFANPVLYEIGLTRGLDGDNDLYKTSFHDVADHVFNGNNVKFHSTCEPVIQGFESVAGYDLTTGWGTPTCGLVQQLSSTSPLVPQSFQFLQVHVANGLQGPALPSIITLEVFGPGFDEHMCTFVLKTASDATWDNGTVNDADFAFASPDCVKTGPIQFNDIDHVILHYDKNDPNDPFRSDYWDVDGFGLRVHGFHTPDVCMIDLSGDDGCVMGCGNDGLLGDEWPGVVRLGVDNNHGAIGPDGVFELRGVEEGCLGTSAPPSSTPFSQLEVVVDTGDSDALSPGDEVDLDLIGSGGDLLDHFVVHFGGVDQGFIKDTEHRVVHALPAPLTLGDIDHAVLSMPDAGTGDHWALSGIQVWGLAANPGAQTCISMFPSNGTSETPITMFGALMLQLKGGCP